MQNEEPPSSGYNFRFAGGDENSYVFDTNYGVKYEIKFRPTFYIFEEELMLKELTFELIIDVANKIEVTPPLDSFTGLTISAIINHFYQRSSLITTIFICDDADKREAARHRRFGRWFTAYNKDKFTKFDFEWTDQSTNKIYISVIITNTNPFAETIKERFELLALDFRQDK